MMPDASSYWLSDSKLPASLVNLCHLERSRTCGPGVVTLDLVATNAGATLDLNTQTAVITYDADGGGPAAPATFAGETAFTMATWTFGDFKIGSDVTFTINTAGSGSSRSIRIIADGQGLTGLGNIRLRRSRPSTSASSGADT